MKNIFDDIDKRCMDDILYEYLKNEWKKNNMTKYQKYFEEWVNNLTETQIYCYNKIWLKR